MTMANKLARFYFYTKLGWNNYIAWWLGAIAYLTIIYELLPGRSFPATPALYALIFAALMAAAFALGYAMKRNRVYSQEHAINTETNPYLNIIIGKKETLGWQSSIEGLKLSIEFYRRQGMDTAKLEEILERQQELLRGASDV